MVIDMDGNVNTNTDSKMTKLPSSGEGKGVGFFINRPILSCVISVLMVLVGIIGLTRLALEQFPEIAPPTVRIMASYTGANAETVQKSVVVPLEEAINGVEGMMYM